MPDREEDRYRRVKDAAHGVGAGLIGATAAAGAGVDPVVAFGTGLIPAAYQALRGLFIQAGDRREQWAIWAWQEAAELVTGGLDILEERAASTDERIELTAKVLEAAARTTMPGKIRALAHVLVDGLDPEGNVDEATVLALALADLESPHVFVLHFIATTEEDGEPGAIPSWTVQEVRTALPQVRVLDTLFAVLTRHGLIADRGAANYPGTVSPSSYGVTEVGERCLLLFGDERQAASD